MHQTKLLFDKGNCAFTESRKNGYKKSARTRKNGIAGPQLRGGGGGGRRKKNVPPP